MNFSISALVENCRSARTHPSATEIIAGLLRAAIAEPDAIAEAVAGRQRHQASPQYVEVFVSDEDLTIYHVAYPPNILGVPHDHAGWGVIGVYAGSEAFNVYEEVDGALRTIGRRVLTAPAVEILAPDLIHNIENPGSQTSGSIHVYGNRHFDLPSRRIWRNEHAGPEPFTLKNPMHTAPR